MWDFCVVAVLLHPFLARSVPVLGMGMPMAKGKKQKKSKGGKAPGSNPGDKGQESSKPALVAKTQHWPYNPTGAWC